MFAKHAHAGCASHAHCRWKGRMQAFICSQTLDDHTHAQRLLDVWMLHVYSQALKGAVEAGADSAAGCG